MPANYAICEELIVILLPHNFVDFKLLISSCTTDSFGAQRGALRVIYLSGAPRAELLCSHWCIA